MFRIKAEHSEQIEVKTSIERAREFFNNLRNIADLMPGIESITTEAGGAKRWMVRADIPTLGVMRAAFAVEQTDNRPERIEWSPAATEKKNYLRLVATFQQRGAQTLVRVIQHVEMRRQHARELHMLAGLVGESRISCEMQKYVADMMKTFLARARAKLETLETN
jgi:carbon monoxide dehydrogenase subunit G